MLIVCSLGAPFMAGAEEPASQSAPSKGNSAVIDIPDDIMNNLGKTPSAPQKPSTPSTPATTSPAPGKSGKVSQSSTKKQGSTTNANTTNKTGKGSQEKPQASQKLSGFRIQVFSDGSNPTTLQARAKARGNAIVAKFPKYRGQVYSFSSSPNWYTRIGNFKTSKEASAALAELKKAFPAFAAEMRVVKSQITIIK